MTVDDMMATWTRIEPQEKAHCVSCSFDANAANVFQAYVRGTLNFAVERVGFMFGTVDEAGAVKVEFIYEPPQEGTATAIMLMRDAQEEKAVDFIAAQLGCDSFTDGSLNTNLTDSKRTHRR
jgi:nuclear protein localization family protein 4